MRVFWCARAGRSPWRRRKHIRGSCSCFTCWRRRVERYRYMRQCAVVARGMNYANAFELSLKLMATCSVVAERFSSADFMHGPIAMIERDFPVILFAPPGKTLAGQQSLIKRLRG